MGRKGDPMKVIVSVFFIVFFVGTGWSQDTGRIEGKIAQPSSIPVPNSFFSDPGETIRNKSVALRKTAGGQTVATTTSDDNGNFVFDAVPAGEYTIWVECSYCWRGGVTQQVAATGTQTLTVNIELQRVSISEKVTVAAGEAQTVEQVSKTVNVITGQEMRDRADFSLVESLRTIPGFRVQQLGGFGRTASIKTRGLRNQDTAILVDGIRFRDPSAITGDATPFLSDITLTSVSNVEVLRGSGSSLYGTNAVGGVVDFQTPEARSGTRGQIGGAAGGLGLGRFRGNISHGLDRFGIGAGISRTVYTKGIDGRDNAYNTNLQSRIDAEPFANTSVSARLFFSDAMVRLNSSPDTLGALPPTNAAIIGAEQGVNFSSDVDDPDSFQMSRFWTGQLVFSHAINSSLVASGYYQALSTQRTNDNGPLGIGFQTSSTSVFDGALHTANAKITWSPGRKHTLTAGYEYERERFGNEGRTPTGIDDFFTNVGQRSHTLYAQDLVNALDGRLQLAGGVRVQRFDLGRPEFSTANAPYSDPVLTGPPTALTFDGALSYYIQRTGTKLRVHAGNGYRIPSLYERYGTFFSNFAGPEFIAIGDPLLKPEKTISFDLGVEQDFSKGRIRLSSTYFYTHLADIIGYGNVVPNIGNTMRPFGGYENQKGGIARGGEFSIKTKPLRSTDMFASYTYTNSDQRNPQVAGTGIVASLGIPVHQFTLVATQRFRRFWVNFDLLATSSYLAPIFSGTNFNTYVYRFRGNRKGDLTGGHTFNFRREGMTLRVFGTIENVFGDAYYENGFRTMGRTARAGISYVF